MKLDQPVKEIRQIYPKAEDANTQAVLENDKIRIHFSQDKMARLYKINK